MSALHDRISDRDWLELGMLEDDAEYIERFREIFGIDINV